MTGAAHAPIGVGLVGYGTSGADLHAPLITADDGPVPWGATATR